ncbi:MAG: hypothetical protein HRT68_15325 [Flavobacteriaceae bacterium]|nr:hypothetical protein [Flavobacteriaceae bacterium]
MKAVLTSLFCFALTMISFAQNNNTDTIQHMTFKGVPIDGTLNEYVSKMKQSGFTLIRTEDGAAVLKGEFAAYKGCIIGVSTLKGKDLVSKITVLFPERETWSSLSSNYFNLKELLTEKYGKPTKVVEKFDTSLKPDDDGDRMYAVKRDNCKYDTTYELENGSIQISIDHHSVSRCFVKLTYIDKINSEKVRQKAIDDL